MPLLKIGNMYRNVYGFIFYLAVLYQYEIKPDHLQ